ncbi:hypothetical protein [Streptomyces triculaminicus]|uniref:hypothetical protein n=1 Tax=Streptomyces triculaminicus TaxID=2816232 RepID=UPI0037CD2718
MPATLTASHPLPSVLPAPVSVPLPAPLSRTDDAQLVSSSCMKCGADVLGWGWVNFDGVGVLLHDTVDDSVPCPVADLFDWETGAPVVTSPEAVAA